MTTKPDDDDGGEKEDSRGGHREMKGIREIVQETHGAAGRVVRMGAHRGGDQEEYEGKKQAPH